MQHPKNRNQMHTKYTHSDIEKMRGKGSNPVQICRKNCCEPANLYTICGGGRSMFAARPRFTLRCK